MSDGFPSLHAAQEELEEGFWSSFSNVMMVILKIFLLVIVVMALNSRNLLEDLRHSVKAEEVARLKARQSAVDAQKAAAQAEFQLKANATLEEQMEYLQQRTSALEMELLKSRAETEQMRDSSEESHAEVARLQALSREQADSLKFNEQSIENLKTELTSKNTEIAGLTTKVSDSEKQLLSLQGEYSQLDDKYQKLLRPARSSKGKQVVEVVYSKAGYSIKRPGEASSRSVGREALDNELAGLKDQYGKELYVKVIIPGNSGLSYNDAWRFTSDMLSSYDYYNQPDESKPAQ